MAQPPDLMDRIVSLCKRRGFVFQSSEIYGGINSCYDYGPLGVELKRNVKEAWWRAMVVTRDDIVGLDSAIIDPTEPHIMAEIAAAKVLLGRDEFCMDYITAERAGKLNQGTGLA